MSVRSDLKPSTDRGEGDGGVDRPGCVIPNFPIDYPSLRIGKRSARFGVVFLNHPIREIIRGSETFDGGKNGAKRFNDPITP